MNRAASIWGKIGLVIFIASSAYAGEEDTSIQSLQALKEAAETHVQQHHAPKQGRMTVEALTLDSRLRLTPCEKPLQATLSGTQIRGTRTSVAVHCSAPVEWTVYVPVSVHIYQNILITNRTLLRGDLIQTGDLYTEEREVSSLSYGYLTDSDRLEGARAVRAIQAQSILTPSSITTRNLIRRGEQVSLLSTAEGIAVRATGTALDDGGIGAHIRIRNTSSGRIVDAIVQAAGVVAILP